MKKLLSFSSWLAILVGVVMVIGGIWGMCFTYQNVSRENITTPSDASIPNSPVRGPFTLKAQADIIREHTLKITGGKTYAEMPQKINKTDQAGKTILDDKGNPVLVPNTARDIWVTETTLTTALNLGIITYVFSGLVLLFGLISIWTGLIFLTIKRKF